MQLSPRSYRIALLTLFLAAFGIRVLATALVVGLDSPPDEGAFGLDVIDYEGFARSMSAGRGYSLPDGTPTARRAPGTSFTLLPIYWLFGRSHPAARLWMCLLSALTCVVVAGIARPVLGPVVALVACAWLAVYPAHVYFATHLLSESGFGLYLALGILLSLRSLRSGAAATAALAGLCWGMAALTRPLILAALPLGWLLAAASAPEQRRPRLRIALVHSLVVVALLVPWVIRNERVMGQATLVTTAPAQAFWGAHDEKTLNNPRRIGYWTRIVQLQDEDHVLAGSETEIAAATWRYGFEAVRENANQLPRLVVWKLWRFVSPFDVTPNPLLVWIPAFAWLATAPFVIAGIALVSRRAPELAALLALPLLATLAAVVATHGATRFRDVLAPCLLIYAASAFVSLARGALVRTRRCRRGLAQGRSPRSAG
jgi:4-amino-4-deoxy-L-arabinose transferase-like glycosyltransferase